MPAIARLVLTAFDARDPLALAEFYSALTGWPIQRTDEEDWVQLQSDGGATLGFQLAPDHEPPVWPSADRPQQAHLDLAVPDLDEGEAQVLGLGATKAEVQPDPEGWRVFLDPAGHPFCLVLGH
jgi:predicted enzyme related to lactoylglutathione lyase